jgi:hypothetical protein
MRFFLPLTFICPVVSGYTCSFLYVPPDTTSCADIQGENVKIGGGGGFIPGIIFHPTVQGVAYARADIGGLYLLNSDDSWTHSRTGPMTLIGMVRLFQNSDRH